MVRPVLSWIPALLVMATIAWFSHQPDWPDAARGQPDWLLHGLAFGLLGGCAVLGLTDAGRRALTPRRAVLAVLLASAYGAFDEWHQSMIPGRDANWQDWAYDTVGAGLCVLALTLLLRLSARSMP